MIFHSNNINLEIESLSAIVTLLRIKLNHSQMAGFRLEVSVALNTKLNSDLVNTYLRLTIGDSLHIRGVIREIQDFEGSWVKGFHYHYKLFVTDEFDRLFDDRRDALYDTLPLYGHIKEILGDNSFSDKKHGIFLGEERYSVHLKYDDNLYSHVVSNGSTGSTLRELFLDRGITYFYDFTKEHSPLVITDHPVALAIEEQRDEYLNILSSERNEIQLKPCVYNVIHEHQVLPGYVFCTGYSSYEPLSSISDRVYVSDTPDVYEIEAAPRTQEELERILQINVSAIKVLCKKNCFEGDGWVNVGDILKPSSMPKQYYVLETEIEITTTGEFYNKVGQCRYKAEAAEIFPEMNALFLSHPLTLTNSHLEQGFSVEPLNARDQILDGDYYTININGHYTTAVPSHYSVPREKESVPSLRKRHMNHAGDQSHNKPLVAKASVYSRKVQGDHAQQVVDGSLNSKSRKTYSDTSNYQSYNLSDHKENKMIMQHDGTFAYDQETNRQNAILLQSKQYRAIERSSEMRLGDQASTDTNTADQGLSYATGGNYYQDHPNSYVVLYGSQSPNDAKNTSIAPVHVVTSQRNNLDDKDDQAKSYHHIESTRADVVDRTHQSGRSAIGYKIDHDIHKHGQKAPDINKTYHNDVNQDIYQNVHSRSFGNLHHDSYQETELTQATPSLTQSSLVDETHQETSSETTIKQQHQETVVHADLRKVYYDTQSNWQAPGLTISGGATSIGAKNIKAQSSGSSSVSTTQSQETLKDAKTVGKQKIMSSSNQVNEDFSPPPDRLLRISFVDRFYFLENKVPDDFTTKNSMIYPFIDEKFLSAIEGRIDFYKAWHAQEYGQLLAPQVWQVSKENASIDIALYLDGDDQLFEGTYFTQTIAIRLPAMKFQNNLFEVLITGVNGRIYEVGMQDDLYHLKPLVPTLLINQDNWSQIAPKQEEIKYKDQSDKEQSKTVMMHHMVISIMEPPIHINLRQDYYRGFYTGQLNLTQDEIPQIPKEEAIKGYNELAKQYDALKPYFEDEKYPQEIEKPFDYWDEEEFNYLVKLAENQGYSLTFFIHGYNVPLGEYADSLIFTRSELSLDAKGYPLGKSVYEAFNQNMLNHSADDPNVWLAQKRGSGIKATFPLLTQGAVKKGIEAVERDSCIGSGAFSWQYMLEGNLNNAAGFNGKNLILYTRVIQVCWQGNPSMATDYIAAVPMAEFAGEKLAKLILKLKDKGIKINLMAHSLGNDVLMHTLNHLGEKNKSIDHVFMWEPAVPNDAFEDNQYTQDKLKEKYLDMIFNGVEVAQINADATEVYPVISSSYNLKYNFPHATNGADKITVLHSNGDNIIGGLQAPKLLNKDEKISDLSTQELTNRIIRHALYDVGKSAAAMGGWGILGWFLPANNDDNYPEAQNLIPKAADLGAGLAFALPSMGVYLIDQLTNEGLGQGDNSLESIYAIANQVGYPLSYFMNTGSFVVAPSVSLKSHYETYYQEWRKTYSYSGFKYKKQTDIPFEATLDEQYKKLVKLFNPMNDPNKLTPFTAMDIVFAVIETLQKGGEDGLLERLLEEIEAVGRVAVLPLGAAGTNSDLFDELVSIVLSNMGYTFDILGHVYNSNIAALLLTPFGITIKQILKNGLNSSMVKHIVGVIKEHKNEFFTVIFTALMTPDAKPQPGMGYAGVDEQTLNKLAITQKKLFQTDQTLETSKLPKDKQAYYPTIMKDNVKYSMLCVDHSAMLFPSDEMMEWVYKATLFGTFVDGAGFDFFGSYNIDQTRSQNMQLIATSETKVSDDTKIEGEKVRETY